MGDLFDPLPPHLHPAPSSNVPPPREASQEGASGPSGVESVAFMLTLPQPPRLTVCVARGEVLSRGVEPSAQPKGLRSPRHGGYFGGRICFASGGSDEVRG